MSQVTPNLTTLTNENYPEWSKPKRSKQHRHCSYCNKDGHDDDHCWKRAADIIRKANTAHKEPSVSIQTAGNATSHSPSISDPLSPIQINTYTHWNVDSGASAHMTPHRHWLHNYTPCRIPIRLADQSIVYSEGVGLVRFHPVINGRKSGMVEFTRVLYVPDLTNNLFSVFYLLRHCGYRLTANSATVRFIHGNLGKEGRRKRGMNESD
jgi:hypothetical protein